MARGGNAVPRQRPLAGRLHRGPRGPLAIPRRVLDGSPRLMARRLRAPRRRRRPAAFREDGRAAHRAGRRARQRRGARRAGNPRAADERGARARPVARDRAGRGALRARPQARAARWGLRDRALPRDGRARARALQRLVRALRAFHGGRGRARHLRRRRRAPRRHRGDGIQRRVPAADPPHRAREAQGQEQHPGRQRGGCGKPVGHRRRGRRPYRDPYGPRQPLRLQAPAALGAAAQDGNRHGPCLPGGARPSLGEGASRLVSAPARRQHPVRRESAQEVRGHLPHRLRLARLASAVAGDARRGRVLGARGRRDLPRRQPAHQALRLLGVADRRGAPRVSQHDLPFGGLHAPARDASPGEARLLAVVHLLHLARHEEGAHRVLHRAHAGRLARILPPQLLAEHARHPALSPAERAACDVPPAPGARGHARRKLRDLRAGLRAGREPPARGGERGIPE